MNRRQETFQHYKSLLTIKVPNSAWLFCVRIQTDRGIFDTYFQPLLKLKPIDLTTP